MANHHFGELGDVWKHLALTEILSIEKPAAYWETHAGAASYPLDESWPRHYGVRRFLAGAPHVSVLAASRYYAQANGFVEQGLYPGSGLLALRELGKACNFLFCDIDYDSVRSLDEAAISLGVWTSRCLSDDGITSIWNATFNIERSPTRVLVFVDPFRPFEESGSSGLTALDLVARLAEKGFRVVFWYGFGDEGDTAHDIGWAWRRLAPQMKTSGVPHWCGEIVLRDFLNGPIASNPGVLGCGVICANLLPESYEAAARLGRALVLLYEDSILPTGESGALVFNDYAIH